MRIQVHEAHSGWTIFKFSIAYTFMALLFVLNPVLLSKEGTCFCISQRFGLNDKVYIRKRQGIAISIKGRKILASTDLSLFRTSIFNNNLNLYWTDGKQEAHWDWFDMQRNTHVVDFVYKISHFITDTSWNQLSLANTNQYHSYFCPSAIKELISF